MRNLIPNNKNGQGTVEYLVMVAAVLATLIIFLRPGGIFSSSVNETVETNIRSMDDVSDRIFNP